MINLCTLFDSNYLDKGLALYYSLKKVSKDFHLYIMAFDKKSFDFLKEKECEDLTVQWLDNFETPELLAVKPTRSRGEYCWTCGPSVLWYFIETYHLDSLTYIDADMMFYHDPQILFDEIGDADVAVSPHFTKNESAGDYCVQFNFFRNSEEGMKALKWWRDSCIEWCFNRYEDDKFGDQGYVRKFPSLFKNVHVMEHRGTGVASWNMDSYDIDFPKKEITFNGKVYPIVFFHYHGVYTSIEDANLIMRTNEFDVKQGGQYDLYYDYLGMIKDIRVKELGQIINSVIIEPRPILKRLDFYFRALLRDNTVARWIKYTFITRKSKK